MKNKFIQYPVLSSEDYIADEHQIFFSHLKIAVISLSFQGEMKFKNSACPLGKL